MNTVPLIFALSPSFYAQSVTSTTTQTKEKTHTKLGRDGVAPCQRIDAPGLGRLLHLEPMLVCAGEEDHRARGVQDALEPRDDVRGEERVEVADVRAWCA